MNFRLVRFQAGHLATIVASEPRAAIDPATLQPDVLEQAGLAYTALFDERPIAAAGLIHVHDNRAIAWAWVGRCSRAQMLRVHRETLRHLRRVRYRRIEAAVRCGYDKGHRWAAMLGFEMEAACMRSYLPCGEDATLYARIKA